VSDYQTTAEVAAAFRCSPRKVRTLAAAHGLGMNVGGRAGYRYSRDDVAKLAAAMRPDPPVRRRRRRAA
jgi:hypothetical protein